MRGKGREVLEDEREGEESILQIDFIYLEFITYFHSSHSS